MSEKYAAFGAQLQRGDGSSSEEFETVAAVASLGSFGSSTDMEDATAHDSPDAREEVVATILRSSDLSLSLRFDADEDTHQQMWDDHVGRQKHNYRLVLAQPDDPTFEFTGFVQSMEIGLEHDGLQEADVTIKPTGAIVTPWSSPAPTPT